jgi:hypothetical protein
MGDRVIKAKVTRIQPKSGRFRLWFEEGKSAIARGVIVAAGSGKPHLAAWVTQIQTQHPAERIRHSHQVDLRNLQLQGKQILIVAGGLTRRHLAVGAIAREAKFLLRTRRYFPEKLLDAELGWLGPKYLKGFVAKSDCHSRWETIQQARKGGSMTREIMTQLRMLSHMIVDC